MSAPSDKVIEKVKVREVTGVFRTREKLDKAIGVLLLFGFDRADIDLMAAADTVREKLGSIYVAAKDLADVPGTPRRIFVARDDIITATALTAGLLSYVGATATAIGIVASGGSLALALAAAATSGAAVGGIGALVTRLLGKDRADELEAQLITGGLVIWVRVRSPEREDKAKRILSDYGAEAVWVHEIEIDKRLEDLPLSSIRPDPWLGDEPLGQA